MLWLPCTAASQHQTEMIAARAPTIPNVVGKTVTEAIDALAWTKLGIVQRDSITKSAPAGNVVDQRPRAGTLVSYAKAETLFVAARPKRQRGQGFNLGAVLGEILVGVLKPPPSRPSDQPVDPADDVTTTVTGSDGGERSVDGKVVQDRTHVPSLFGRTFPMVAAALKDSQLTAGKTVNEYSDEIPNGRAIRSHPSAGTEVLTWSDVTVWYSIGPHPERPTITVPDITGLSESDANDSLRRAGLTRGHVDYVSRAEGNGTVWYQTPKKGEAAHSNDAVDFTIANPRARVSVPEVIGLSRKDAAGRLRRAGLAIGRVTLVVVPDRDTVIISQTPEARSRVDSGTLIDIVENRPPEVHRAVVPDLKGKTLFESALALRENSLLLGEVIRLGARSVDTVSEQRPAAGESVFVNSEVSVALGVQGSAQSLVLPDVVNLSVDSARGILSDSGFARVSIAGRGDPLTSRSIVESQNPVAGTVMDPSVTVSLVARAPVPPLPVPNLVGKTRAQAQTMADIDNLTMIVTSEVRRLRFKDRVASQDPAPPSPRRADNRINVTVEVPVIPPLVAGLLALAVVGGIALMLLVPPPTPPIEPSPPSPPPQQSSPTVTLEPVTKVSETPVIHVGGHENIVSSAFTLRFDVTSDPAEIEVPEESLVKSEESQDA